jgi:hypothetical protein
MGVGGDGGMDGWMREGSEKGEDEERVRCVEVDRI